MKKIFSLFILAGVLSISTFAKAEFSYDVSGSSGTRDGETVSEIHLGLNWQMSEYFNWRNSVFTRYGTDIKTVNGLDSAALFNFDAYTEGRGLGIELFAGPGVRLASENSNAAFGKAGVTFALGGLRIGGGVQVFHYIDDREDKAGNTLGKDETQYFITLSGGGKL